MAFGSSGLCPRDSTMRRPTSGRSAPGPGRIRPVQLAAVKTSMPAPIYFDSVTRTGSRLAMPSRMITGVVAITIPRANASGGHDRDVRFPCGSCRQVPRTAPRSSTSGAPATARTVETNTHHNMVLTLIERSSIRDARSVVANRNHSLTCNRPPHRNHSPTPHTTQQHQPPTAHRPCPCPGENPDHHHIAKRDGGRDFRRGVLGKGGELPVRGVNPCRKSCLPSFPSGKTFSRVSGRGLAPSTVDCPGG
jgi:hypothetical protein